MRRWAETVVWDKMSLWPGAWGSVPDPKHCLGDKRFLRPVRSFHQRDQSAKRYCSQARVPANPGPSARFAGSQLHGFVWPRLGAGVVTKGHPDYALVLGHPTRRADYLRRCGTRLTGSGPKFTCWCCEAAYRVEEGELEPLAR